MKDFQVEIKELTVKLLKGVFPGIEIESSGEYRKNTVGMTTYVNKYKINNKEYVSATKINSNHPMTDEYIFMWAIREYESLYNLIKKEVKECTLNM